MRVAADAVKVHASVSAERFGNRSRLQTRGGSSSAKPTSRLGVAKSARRPSPWSETPRATRILPAERPSRGAQRVSSGPALRTTQRCYPRYSPSHNWRRPSRAKSRYPRDTCSARYAAWRDAASREPSIRMEALASSSNADESRWTVVGSPRAGSVAMRPRLDCTSAKLLLSMQMPAEANDRPVGAKERDSEITLEAPRISTCELVVSGLETRAQRLASRATLGMACMIGSRSRPPARPW